METAFILIACRPARSEYSGFWEFSKGRDDCGLTNQILIICRMEKEYIVTIFLLETIRFAGIEPLHNSINQRGILLSMNFYDAGSEILKDHDR